MRKNTFGKKNYLMEMPIEQIKNLQGKSSSGLLFAAEILHEQCTLIYRSWGQSLTKFNPKMQDFKYVLNLNRKEKKG